MVDATDGSSPRTENETENDSRTVKSLVIVKNRVKKRGCYDPYRLNSCL